ncbi:universal stress protein [Halobacterium sp. R2-5]|uniref:universal stress protein n=1 Tax=Halobacterium sp. R2-5 TaxID=2715751 RepID=UPI00141D834F|nr:universal stress protein [Halobacterium sp. R2-5]NIC01026.1 universal stress protein [Halobacterium sp. R2-5]
MATIAVVLDSAEANEQLLETAKRHVTGTDLEIVLCRIVDRDEYEGDVRRQAESSERVDSIEEVEREAKAEAEAVGEKFFGDDVSFTAVGAIGTIPEDVIKIADEWDTNHVFIAGKKRSPAGKMLFGDEAQKLILDFYGPVTVVTENSS